MIPPVFEYTAPDTLEDALSALVEGGEDAKLLAGGHSLLPLMKLRLAAPSLLVDLRKVPGLRGVERANGDWRIGAMTRHSDLQTASEMGVVARVASLIADQQVRNRGTIGGSLVHGDPASDMPTVLVALDGSVTLTGRGGSTREVAAGELFQDYLTTAVGPDEVLTEVRLPALEGWGWGYEKFARRAEDWAMVGVVALVRKGGDGSCEDVRIGLTHMASTPIRAHGRRGRPARPGPRRVLDRQGRRAGGRGHPAAGRPQRHAGLQAPPGARPDPASAGAGGRGLVLSGPLASPDAVGEALREQRYLADRALATAVFLAGELGQPLLVEGEAGVGKTEVAKALAGAAGARLIRLQCHEGIDVHQALYDWDYARQLLALRAAEGGVDEGELFSRRFLLRRPLLEALEHDGPVVLLVDEVDRADDEFEAFLLELLSDFQVTIPELGETIAATQRPLVVLTSNRTRELHDALKRRCLYHWIDYPSPVREAEIVRARVPGVAEAINARVCEAVARLRDAELYKLPGVGETIAWAQALTALGEQTDLDETLGVALKVREDLERVRRIGTLEGV